ITFDGPINGDGSPILFRIETARGDVTLGTVGNSVPLAGLRIVHGDRVVLNGPVTVGYLDQQDGEGITTINCPVTALGPVTAVSLVGANLVLNAMVAARGQTIYRREAVSSVDNAGLRAGQLALEGTGSYRVAESRHGDRHAGGGRLRPPDACSTRVTC